MTTAALPRGFSARPIELVDGDGPDVDSALEVVLGDHSSVLSDPDDTRESVRSSLISPDAIVDEHRLVIDDAGNAVALLIVEREGPTPRAFFDAYALPGVKEQLLPALIEMGVAAARRVAGDRAGWEVGSAGYTSDTVLMNHLAAAGFHHVRRFWRMRVSLAGYPLNEPPPPPGVTRTVVNGENDRRLLHSVHESAFAEHFGSTAERYEEWITFFDHRDDSRPDLQWLAWRDGQVIAECTADDSRAESGQSYIRTLGVLPQARGLGVGRWLLQCQFAQAAREGRHFAMLTVDSDNTTGATRLYESVGMQPHHVIDLLHRDLQVGPSSAESSES